MAPRSLDLSRTFLSVLSAGFLLAQIGAAHAVGSGASGASRADEIARFQADPKTIFFNDQGRPASNPELISNVRELVIADKADLKPVIEQLKLASADEQAAIGTALGQAAQAVLRTDPAYAAEIQEALAAAGFQNAILAFAAVTGNVPIGAAGAAGAAGAGGVGGGAGGGAGGGGGSAGSSSGAATGSGAASGSGVGGLTGSTFNTPGVTTTSVTTPATTTVTNTVTPTVTSAQTSVSP
jgi:hypothetical protein